MARHSKREAIVEAGLRLVWHDGFGASGVAAITAAGGAPKGSFYNHFASKDAFGVALVERYLDRIEALVGDLAADQRVLPRDRITAYFAELRQRGARERFAAGCLIGNLSAEAPGPEVRDALAAAYAEWAKHLGALVAGAQRDGAAPDGDPAAIAALLIDGWQGALLRARAQRSGEPLDDFLSVTLPALLGPPQATP
ncbi:MAG: TetR family transcriptional regulator C-terminal domain-containing protein [Gaiellales bacterium]